jgi:hypothetical protein
MLTMQGAPKKITARAYFPVILHEVRGRDPDRGNSRSGEGMVLTHVDE